jgi:hypothetical protein
MTFPGSSESILCSRECAALSGSTAFTQDSTGVDPESTFESFILFSSLAFTLGEACLVEARYLTTKRHRKKNATIDSRRGENVGFMPPSSQKTEHRQGKQRQKTTPKTLVVILLRKYAPIVKRSALYNLICGVVFAIRAPSRQRQKRI